MTIEAQGRRSLWRCGSCGQEHALEERDGYELVGVVCVRCQMRAVDEGWRSERIGSRTLQRVRAGVDAFLDGPGRSWTGPPVSRVVVGELPRHQVFLASDAAP